jgi:mercuric transport protein
MGLTFIILGYAFYKIYRKPKAEECAPGSYCANPKSDRINKITLWISTVFVILLLSFPYITPLLYADQSNAVEQSGFEENMLMEVTLDVPDMYCPACPFTVQKSLIKLDGVISAEASLETKKAIIKFDPTRVTIAQMIDGTTNAGYPSVMIEN